MKIKTKTTKIAFMSLVALVASTSLFGCESNQDEKTNEATTTEQADAKTDEVTATTQVGETPQGGRPNGGSGGGGMGMSSLDTSFVETAYTDIQYGTQSSTQTLNIYMPNENSIESDGPIPVIIAIHGGGFMMGSNTGGDLQSMLEGVNRGYAVVTVNYRLSGEETFPGAISDVKAAIRYIKAHAEEYNLDVNNMAVWGDSAGGNLAALVGTSGDTDELNGDNLENLEYTSDVAAVVDWFGPINFLTMDEQFAASGTTPKMGATSSESSPESKYIGQLITDVPEIVAQANPTTYISSNDQAVFYIQHGSADTNVPTQQSTEFAQALVDVLGVDKVTYEILEGASHGGGQFDSTENLDKIFAFLDQVLKSK